MRYVYDPAKTPLQRLLLSGILPDHKQQELTKVVQAQANPERGSGDIFREL